MSHYLHTQIMIKISKIIITGIILMYWLTTLLYNSPNNYLKIKFSKELSIFDMYFDQQWEFFAPPPTFNNRLYYTFLDDNRNEIATFEILSQLSNDKKNARPFNEREEMIDYIINGSVVSIVNQIIAVRDLEKINHSNFDIEKLNAIALEKITDNPYSISGYGILKNYSKTVAQNYLDKKYKSIKYVTIKINTVPIKKFSQRYSTKPDVENNIISFKSSQFQ